jgi:Protein of unknown function (DUF3810)
MKKLITSVLKRNYFWFFAGLLALALKFAASSAPSVVENLYSRRVFLGIRMIFDLLSWSPIPLMYLFWFLVLRFLWLRLRKLRQWTWGGSISSILNFVGGFLCAFFVLWGYNYNRVAVEQQLALPVKPLDGAAISRAFAEETERVQTLRAELSTKAKALDRSFLPEDLESRLRKDLKACLAAHDYPAMGKVRGRLLYPKGIFLRFSSAGLYWPFVGEGQIDPGMHVLQWPYVLTHEMSHGYGFADEGDCNFWAYLSCVSSRDLSIRYAGHLSYWRSLAAQYRRYYPEEYAKTRKSLAPGIQADLDAINERILHYPDLIPNLQPRLYDAYLKSQGISEGMLNYDRVVMLAEAYKQKKQRK